MEAATSAAVKQILKQHKVPVKVPAVFHHLVQRRCMVLKYIDGSRFTDAVQAASTGGERERLEAAVEAICDALAVQMFLLGTFHGDPHPGNIMLQRSKQARGMPCPAGTSPSSQKPVLLDFGLAKALPDEFRLGLASMVVAAADEDYDALLDSFEAIGLKINRLDEDADFMAIRYAAALS